MKKILILIAILIIPITTNAGLSDGLVGYWSLDKRDTVTSSDTVGKVFDRSSNSNYGTISNFASISGAKYIGKIFQALNFDGTDDYINLPNNSSLKPANITISVWIKAERTTGGIIEYASDDGYLFLFVGGKLRWYLHNSAPGDWTYVESTETINTGQWYNFIGTFDGSTSRFYINGTLIGSASKTSAIRYNESRGPIIGKYFSPGDYFKGLIDDVRLYNRALSASEIMQLYRTGLTKFAI